MIQLSEITNSISPSLTRRLFNLAQKYDNVIDFTLGDPDIHPHDKIKEAGCKYWKVVQDTPLMPDY